MPIRPTNLKPTFLPPVLIAPPPDSGMFCNGGIPVVVLNGCMSLVPVGLPESVMVSSPVTCPAPLVEEFEVVVLNPFVILVLRAEVVVVAGTPVIEALLAFVGKVVSYVIVALKLDHEAIALAGMGAIENPFSAQSLCHSAREKEPPRS